MSEEKTEKVVEEKTFEVPLFTVDDEVFNKMVATLKEKEDAVTPPEGQEFKGMKAYCSKHGDITGACQMINFVRVYKHGDDMIDYPEQEVLCKACYAEWIRDMRKKGIFGNVRLFPIFAEKKVEGVKEAKVDSEPAPESK